MHTMIRFFVIATSTICVTAQGQQATVGQVAALQSGEYELRLITPKMAAKNKDVALPARIQGKGEELVIQTQGMMGNPITLKGMQKKDNIKIGMTAIEGDHIISFHYIGTADANNQAKGRFHCFIDGKAAFAGEWVLAKKKEEANDPE